jgi:uroporphyrinogen-III synthase
MTRPLARRTIALAEGRQLEDLAQMLEKEGASILRCPMIGIIDAPDPEPVLAWLRELAAGRFAYVIFLTGEGVRRLLGFAERDGMRDAVISALGQVKTITRGPKPGKALKEIGLAPTKVAATPTTEGVIAALKDEPIRGQVIGVQFYSETNPHLTLFLEHAGAPFRTVLPYVYAPASDADQVASLIGQMAAGLIDALVFTSSPQVDRLYEVAKERGLEAKLTEGLQRTKVAAVGPIVAENLRTRRARVDICPEQGFVMKNLVQLIRRELAS